MSLTVSLAPLRRALRRWWVPEVIQTSAMDCGPAVLKAALEGFGVSIHLGRLREACQTDVDGTSITTLESLAAQLGLRPLQTLAPPEHLPLPSAVELPAIAVTERPDGTRHFVLLWRRVGPFVVLMDPSAGRRLMRWSSLVPQLYRHQTTLDAATARRWLHAPVFLAGLGERLTALGVDDAAMEALLGPRLGDPDALGALMQATHAVSELVEAGAVRAGSEASAMVGELADAPASMRDTLAGPPPLHREGDDVHVRAAVLLLLRAPDLTEHETSRTPAPTASVAESPLQPDSSALAAALAAPPERPLRAVWELVREAEPRFAWLVTVIALTAAAGGIAQGALMRALLDAGRWVQVPSARAGAIAVILVLVAALGLTMWGWSRAVLRIARRVELRARERFHAKLPRLSDRYFSSRLSADLAERAHSLHALRGLPPALGGLVLATANLIATSAGILWLDIGLWPWVVASVLFGLAVPGLLHAYLAGREMRRQTWDGALSRTYLDAMLGASVVAAHGAAETVRRDHEELLTGWQRAAQQAADASVLAGLLQGVVGLSLAAGMVHAHLITAPHAAAVLLLVYWGTGLPRQSEALARAMRALPALQSIASRALELLDAPEEPAPTDSATHLPPGPLAVRAHDVHIVAGGRTVLHLPELRIEAGEHIAIVGASGAGKSTFLAALLGLQPVGSGVLRVGGVPLTPELLGELRRRTAWVDPAVQLWNDTLVTNLQYGHADRAGPLDAVLEAADLLGVLADLPGGLAAPLGQGGALLSGGQGQRVRIGRALGRPDAGLVLLDEAFRGLDRGQRQLLLHRARQHWSGATLLAVTHDVSDTAGFERVLVVHNGRIVEDGAPAELRGRRGRYAALAARDEAVREALMGGPGRRLRLERGKVVEDA